MKMTFLAVALAATTSLVPSVQAKESILVLSPFATGEAKQAQIRVIGQYLADTTEAGETSYVLDGWSQETMATFSVPDDGKRYARVSSRMRANPGFFRAMKSFADAAQPERGDQHLGQIVWPGVIRRIGRDFETKEPRDLIFFDVSPVYHDTRAPEVSMRDGRLFNDAHLALSRDVTPFGAQGQSDYLSNYTVHWGMAGGAWVVSDRHAHHAERIMALSVSTRDGTLATFATDGNTALENARAGKSRAVGDYQLNSDGRPMMFGFQAQAATPSVSIYERPVSNRVPGLSEITQARAVEVAIRWECACDFDLAVKPEGGTPISFRTPTSEQGQLFKDFTSSAALNNGWETISLPGPIDLTRAVIAANLFSGRGGNAELRLAIAGETWAMPISVTGPASGGLGYEQAMSSGRAANAAWAAPSVMDIMGVGR
jgi:hypothetical protein